MLATLGGLLALLLGLLLLLLPLLASELSRARDSVWGAVVLLLGLVLVTSAERLTGAPMLAVLCGGLLIGRLGVEVGQARWRLLTEEERQRLWSLERWQTSLSQLGASLARLLQLASGVVSGLGAWLAERRATRPASTKKWVRPEADNPEGTPAGAPATATAEVSAVAVVAEVTELAEITEVTAAAEPTEAPAAEPQPDDGPLVVDGFEAIDALLEQAVPETPETVNPPETAGAGEGLGEAG